MQLINCSIHYNKVLFQFLAALLFLMNDSPYCLCVFMAKYSLLVKHLWAECHISLENYPKV